MNWPRCQALRRSWATATRLLTPEIAVGLSPTSDRHGAGQTPSRPDVVRIEPLSRGPGQAPVWIDDRFAHSFIEEVQVSPGAQTRPNLKVQEGCGNRCTFCVIPQTRGSSRSLPAASVLKQVEGFVAAGGNELVLSGINLGRWGRDLPSGTRSRGEPDGFPPFRQYEGERMGHGTFLGSRRQATLAGLVRRILDETELSAASPQLD